MEHIDQNAVIGYEVPLRITFSRGEMVVERDVREAHRHTLGQCGGSERCEMRFLHQNMYRTRVTHVKGAIPGVRYSFGIGLDWLETRVLVAPKRYEVLVADPRAYCDTCHGVLYHDSHRTREPIDLERVVATLDENVLTLRLPRLDPKPRVSSLTIADWPGPDDLGK